MLLHHSYLYIRDALREKSDSLEQEARHAKEQLAEMARTATDYSNMIKKKEEDADRLADELDKSKQERGRLLKQIAELQANIDALTAELEVQQSDRKRDASAQSKLLEELDELRALLEAKTTEETRRSEVEKSKEQELADLREQVAQVTQELDDARRSAVDSQNKLKIDLDTIIREHSSLEQSHKSLSDRERFAQAQLKKTESSLGEADKAKRTLESELQSIRSRQNSAEDELAEVRKAKEVSSYKLLLQIDSLVAQALERQLSTAQAKYKDFEDVVLQLEREKSLQDRQMDAMKKQLDSESTKRAHLEKSASSQKAEIARLKDINIKLDRELNKALSDLKAREWEVKQLEAKQDKTIVEHVHVLEEAKRVTDRQLQKAQEELQANTAYIRSLEKAKSRFMNEAEDLAREKEHEQVELRAKDKRIKAEEEKAHRALTSLEMERRSREAAELHVRRLQQELQSTQNQVSDVMQQFSTVQKAKENLELELTRLADETDAPNSAAKLQRQYESRIAQLESQLEDAEIAKTTALRIKEHVDRQHAEIRRLIMNNGPKDESFRSRLLKELQLADEEMERELSMRQQTRLLTGSDARSMANVTPSKRHTNGTSRTRKDSHPEAPRTPDRQAQVNALKHQVQILEIQMAASNRVRQYLESSLKEMTDELENSDGSKQSLEQYRARLAKENARLAELLEDEAEARRAAEAAQLNGIQAMWDKFQTQISEERQSYARLEESRKALVRSFVR